MSLSNHKWQSLTAVEWTLKQNKTTNKNNPMLLALNHEMLRCWKVLWKGYDFLFLPVATGHWKTASETLRINDVWNVIFSILVHTATLFGRWLPSG